MKMVLIVEDDRDLTELLGTALELSGYAVKTAIDSAAISLAQEARPNVILLDIQMPGMDGIQIAQHLRADERTRSIPIVLMSASYRLAERGREVQVERLLPKPFDLNTMLDYVDELAGP